MLSSYLCSMCCFNVSMLMLSLLPNSNSGSCVVSGKYKPFNQEYNKVALFIPNFILVSNGKKKCSEMFR